MPRSPLTIQPSDDPDVRPLDPETANMLRQLQRAPKVTIMVNDRRGEEESDDVFVGVNGVNFQIQRGVEVEVPLPVAMVLENAKQTVYETRKSPEGRTIMIERIVSAYPFSWMRGRPAGVGGGRVVA